MSLTFNCFYDVRGWLGGAGSAPTAPLRAGFKGGLKKLKALAAQGSVVPTRLCLL